MGSPFLGSHSLLELRGDEADSNNKNGNLQTNQVFKCNNKTIRNVNCTPNKLREKRARVHVELTKYLKLLKLKY
jgi:hypothetical protein